MNSPQKSLNPLPNRPQPGAAGAGPETLDFGDAMTRLVDATESIALVLERRAVKDGLLKLDECAYEHPGL